MTTSLRSAARRWSRPLVLAAAAVAVLVGPGAGGAEAHSCASVRVTMDGNQTTVGQCDWHGADHDCVEYDVRDGGTGAGLTSCAQTV